MHQLRGQPPALLLPIPEQGMSAGLSTAEIWDGGWGQCWLLALRSGSRRGEVGRPRAQLCCNKAAR